MNTTLHPLAEDYLRRLEQSAQALPRDDRAELLAEIRGHLEAGLPPEATDADVRNLLGELGTPDDIVAAAQPGPDGQPAGLTGTAPRTVASQWGPLELIAVLALTLGAFVVPVVGPIVGIFLVWASTRWTRHEKRVATVLTVLPVIVLALGFALTVTVRSSGVDEPVREQAPVPVTSTGESS